MTTIGTVTLMIAALVPPAVADCRVWTDLLPTADGELLAATGRAEAWAQNDGAQQTFMVDVGIGLPDETPLFVFANGEPAGTITVGAGVASMNLTDAAGAPLPFGVDPVCAIGPIWVNDAGGTTLLFGF
jgi:hypothetical protein